MISQLSPQSHHCIPVVGISHTSGTVLISVTFSCCSVSVSLEPTDTRPHSLTPAIAVNFVICILLSVSE